MDKIIWILKPKKDNLDLTSLVIKISNNQDINLSDYELGQVHSVVHTFKDEIVDYLIEHGYSSLVSTEPLLEHIVAKGTPDNKIIPIVQKYLDRIGVDKELIIIDPYFYATRPKNPNYVAVLGQILEKYLSTIENLIIVTSSYKIDFTIKNQIESTLKLKKSNLNIIHKENDDFHDRYWISGAREKGIVMGTSLNSLGNKFALLDRLNKNDIDDIIEELKSSSLI